MDVRDAQEGEGTPPELKERRAKLQKALETYVSASYPKGEVAVYGGKRY